MSGRSNQRRLRSLKRNRPGVTPVVALHMKRIRWKIDLFYGQFGSLRNDDGDGNGNGKEAIGLDPVYMEWGTPV